MSVFQVFDDANTPIPPPKEVTSKRDDMYKSAVSPILPFENPEFRASAPGDDLVYAAFSGKSESSSELSDSYSPQPTGESLYPDLGNFNTEAYLPNDYKDTIGKKYDLTEFQHQLEQMKIERGEKDSDDDEE